MLGDSTTSLQCPPAEILKHDVEIGPHHRKTSCRLSSYSDEPPLRRKDTPGNLRSCQGEGPKSPTTAEDVNLFWRGNLPGNSPISSQAQASCPSLPPCASQLQLLCNRLPLTSCGRRQRAGAEAERLRDLAASYSYSMQKTNLADS